MKRNRRQKKATQRTAFIQEIAIAVRKVLYPGWEPKSPLESFEAAYDAHQKLREQELYHEHRQPKVDATVLAWAKKMGLLPAEATQLPNVEEQRRILRQQQQLPVSQP